MNQKANSAPGGSGDAADCDAQRYCKPYSLNRAENKAPRSRPRDRAAPIRASYTIPAEPRRVTLADIEQMLTVLPYGRYIASDGREILFNRSYRPIWERLPDGVVQRANSNEWIDWVRQGWFGCGSMRYEKSAREAYRKVLRDFLDGKPLTVENERRRPAKRVEVPQ